MRKTAGFMWNGRTGDMAFLCLSSALSDDLRLRACLVLKVKRLGYLHVGRNRYASLCVANDFRNPFLTGWQARLIMD